MFAVVQFVAAVARAAFWTVRAFPRASLALLVIWWIASKGQGL